MADENKSNLTPEQMAARIAELDGRLTLPPFASLGLQLELVGFDERL